MVELKKYILTLVCAVIILCTGCKIVRAIGETIGVVDEKPQQEEVQPVEHTQSESIKVQAAQQSSKNKYVVWVVIFAFTGTVLYIINRQIEKK